MPLFQIIRDRLRADIAIGRARGKDGRLPTERELAAQYQVSRPTVRKALAALAAEGVVRQEHRRGVFLAGDGRVGAPARPDLRQRIAFVAPFGESALSHRELRGILRVAWRRGYQVLMGCSGPTNVANEQAVVAELIDAGARGLIVTPAPRRPATDDGDYLVGDPLPVPVVLTDMAAPWHKYAQVVFDNERAAYAMTSWLIGLGHRRIGLMTCPEHMLHPTLMARAKGYRNALADRGIAVDPALVRNALSDHALSLGPELGRQAWTTEDEQVTAALIDEWMAMEDAPTAVIAIEDLLAVSAIEHLLRRGVRVPERVQVVGFDNREEVRRYRVPFATTNPDFERMGEIAGDLVLDMVESGQPDGRIFVLDVPLLQRRRHEAAMTAGLPVELAATG